MQADKKEAAAAAPAAGKPPSICDRLQRAFHARPAFRPLRRLTVRHQDGGAAKPADAGAGADAGAAPGPEPKHSSPPVPAPPQPLTPSPATKVGGATAATARPAPQPVPVRLPAVAEKAAVASAPPGPPVPVPPPDVTAGMATPADAKAGDKAQQTKGKTRVGSRVRKALSSK